MFSIFAILFTLQCASATITLDCTYAMNVWSFVGSVYTCQPKVIKTGETNYVVEVSQNHQSGKTNQDVKALIIQHEPIDSIPKDINLLFANLEFMFYFKCPIKSITKDDLKPFPKLKVFEIIKGQLAALDGDVFKYSPELQFLDFSNNQITNVGPGIFDHTPKLTSAHFYNNLCINNYSSNNATAVANLAKELALNCPPTAAKIEEFILAGEKFKTAIKIQAEASFANSGTKDQVQEYGNKIVNLEEKVEKLGKFIAHLCKKLKGIDNDDEVETLCRF